MIGGDGQVGYTALEHAQYRCQYASDRSYLSSVRIPGGGKGVVVPEQLVSAIDQMYVQSSLQ